ncbi:hypothetical protein HDV00_011402, partial [Rhizophlyctis rosea]
MEGYQLVDGLKGCSTKAGKKNGRWIRTQKSQKENLDLKLRILDCADMGVDDLWVYVKEGKEGKGELVCTLHDHHAGATQAEARSVMLMMLDKLPPIPRSNLTKQPAESSKEVTHVVRGGEGDGQFDA